MTYVCCCVCCVCCVRCVCCCVCCVFLLVACLFVFRFPPSAGPISSPTAIIRMQTSWVRRPSTIMPTSSVRAGRLLALQPKAGIRSFGPVQYKRILRAGRSLPVVRLRSPHLGPWSGVRRTSTGRRNASGSSARISSPPCLTLLLMVLQSCFGGDKVLRN